VGHKVGSIGLDRIIVKPVPILSRREIAPPREPVPACETHNREQCILNLVEDQHRSVGCRRSDGGLVEDHDLRELGQKHLGVASLSLALLAGPIGNRMDLDGLPDGFGHRLLLLGGRERELVDCVGTQVLVLAVVALNGGCDAEASQLVKEGNLVAEKLNQLVRIANALSSRHMGRHLDTLVQRLQSLIASTAPNLCETHLNRVLAIFFIIRESLLQIRNAEDCLKCCVDPARSVLVSKSEGDHLT